MKNVYAVVCTYNRKQLVARCIEAIARQTEPPAGIVVFDNASTDGTESYIEKIRWPDDPPIHYFRTERNLGCAGGFRRAFELALGLGAEWVWTMDDDTIVTSDALAELKRACDKHFPDASKLGFVTSRIVTPDGEPNNVQLVDDRLDENGYNRWAELLADGLVKVRWTSLNATLLPRDILLRHGGPCTDFVTWGEDIDFTSRIVADRPGYVAGRALVVHHTRSRGQLNVFDEVDPQRIRNLFYHYRNGVYIRRAHYGLPRALLFIGKSVLEALRCLAMDRPILRSRSIVFGVIAGCFFRPRHKPLDIDAPIREWHRVLQHEPPRPAPPNQPAAASALAFNRSDIGSIKGQLS